MEEQNPTPTRAPSLCQHTFGQPKTLRLVLWSTSLASVNLSLCPCEIMPKRCSGQGQMSFVPEQTWPCFVPFLSRPPGWGCSRAPSPKLPCLTSAAEAQGTPLPWTQSSCVSCEGSAAGICSPRRGEFVRVLAFLSALGDCRSWHACD